jgi:hypothetical protein
MSRSSGRGQVEPTAALVVVLAVSAAVSAYAVALDGADAGVGERSERELGEPTLERVTGALVTGGVADPGRTDRAHRAGPSGYRLNVTVAAAGKRWQAGPTPPRRATTDVATRRVGVRIGPGRIRPGRVRVEVWS